MKKLVVSVTAACATFVSTSAAFADEPVQPPPTESQSTSLQVPTPTTTPMTTTVTTTTQPTGAPNSPTPAPVTESAAQTSTTQTTSASYYMAPEDHAEYTIENKRRPNRPLLVTGTAIFLATYGATAIAQAANDGPDKALYIPVAGPWLHLADRQGTEGKTAQTLFIGASGVLQGLGVGLAIVSLAIPERHAVATISAGPVKMAVGPGAVAGTF